MENFKLVNEYIAATNSHDFDNLVPLIDKNATYQFTDKVCIGIDEIRQYFEKTWRLIQDEVYSAKDIRLVYQNNEIKIYTYEYHYQGYYQSEFVSGKGRATNIFQKADDTWVLILEHLNSSQS